MEDIVKYKAVLFYPVMIAMIICLFPVAGLSDMQSLDETEMHDIYAEGFSEFTLSRHGIGNADATMELWLNINTAQYTTIDTLKLGWHDQYNYKDPDPNFNWDHDWRDVEIGSGVEPDNNFYTEGFYFRAEFENFDASNRRLKSVTYGFDYVKGDISADFVSYTGVIDDGDGSPEYHGHNMNLGQGSIRADWDNSNTGGLELALSIDNPYIGYWMTFENARFTPTP
jgi:hypothetical protein